MMYGLCFFTVCFSLSLSLLMACENKKNGQKRKKPGMFTQTEIEMARQLIQLSNSIADSSSSQLQEDGHSFNSESVQWKWQESNNDDESGAVEDVLAEIEEDESLRRRNNRYRYIQDLYNATEPLLHLPAFMDRH
ncbi:unnamed protein product [Sphenostylis stenocarpa]|uniref:Uncharacterized protein n=1 Tax=Sphenostylis stenocarpa TaxID=92480 RepID=A0AA86SP41_9FABA|nr:unnamed protein product [Sphenostylis stenocarpa]